MDFGVRCVKIDDRDCKVNFWDLSGHKDFYHVRNEFYADTQGVSALINIGYLMAVLLWYPYVLQHFPITFDLGCLPLSHEK